MTALVDITDYRPNLKQREAHESTAPFLLYGGAVGGGKSYWLCMDALRLCLAWNHNVVGIYRWEFASFKSTTFATMQETILGRYGGFVAEHNQNDKWIRLKNGSLIRYGGLKPSESASADILKVAKSLELNAIYLDEATDVPQKVFDFLGTRLGRVRCQWAATGEWERPSGRLRCTCNPEICYLKTIFIDSPRPGHQFIRSTWKDNAANLPEDFEQVAFGHMSKEWRARYRDGDWTAATDVDVLLPPELLLRAVRTSLPAVGEVELGVDVASAGDDRSSVFKRVGPRAELLWAGHEPNILVLSAKVMAYADRIKPRTIKVDAVGLGEGVWRDLEREGYPVVPMVGGASARDESRNFRNQRAEIYWGFRERLQEGKADLPDYPELIQELGTIRYSQSASGQTVQIESKKEIKKRLGHSPDLADGCVYCYAYGEPEFTAVAY